MIGYKLWDAFSESKNKSLLAVMCQLIKANEFFDWQSGENLNTIEKY